MSRPRTVYRPSYLRYELGISIIRCSTARQANQTSLIRRRAPSYTLDIVPGCLFSCAPPRHLSTSCLVGGVLLQAKCLCQLRLGKAVVRWSRLHGSCLSCEMAVWSKGDVSATVHRCDSLAESAEECRRASRLLGSKIHEWRKIVRRTEQVFALLGLVNSPTPLWFLKLLYRQRPKSRSGA